MRQPCLLCGDMMCLYYLGQSKACMLNIWFSMQCSGAGFRKRLDHMGSDLVNDYPQFNESLGDDGNWNVKPD